MEVKTVPVEAEVNRLIRENNLLHEQIIREKQLAQNSESKLMLSAKREADMKADFTYLLGTKDSRIQVIIDDNMSLKAKIEELVHKGLDSVQFEKGGKVAAELRKKVAEIHATVQEIRDQSKTVYSLVASLKKAEESLIAAKELASNTEADRLALQAAIEGKEQALLLRDKEIKRLQGKTLEEGVAHLEEFWNKNYSE